LSVDSAVDILAFLGFLLANFLHDLQQVVLVA
jgi:hypothetical protein